VVSAIFFVVITVMMMGRPSVAVVLAMVVIEVKSNCGREVSRTSERRRYDAGELGYHEQGDQHANETTYGP